MSAEFIAMYLSQNLAAAAISGIVMFAGACLLKAISSALRPERAYKPRKWG